MNNKMLANCQSKRNALFMIIGRGLQDIGRPRQNPLDRALLCIISWQSFITLLIFDLWHINENSLLPTWSIIESWYFMIVFWNFKRVVLFSYMLWSRALKSTYNRNFWSYMTKKNYDWKLIKNWLKSKISRF